VTTANGTERAASRTGSTMGGAREASRSGVSNLAGSVASCRRSVDISSQTWKEKENSPVSV
jgi:hypothetical protein